MKIYKAAIIGLGPSGLAVNKILYGEKKCDIIAFENIEINNRDNFFGFWMTDWMKPFENLIQKKNQPNILNLVQKKFLFQHLVKEQ